MYLWLFCAASCSIIYRFYSWVMRMVNLNSRFEIPAVKFCSSNAGALEVLIVAGRCFYNSYAWLVNADCISAGIYLHSVYNSRYGNKRPGKEIMNRILFDMLFSAIPGLHGPVQLNTAMNRADSSTIHRRSKETNRLPFLNAKQYEELWCADFLNR